MPVPDSLVKSLVRAGQIHPVRSGNEVRYSSRDRIVLSMAGGMHAANIPPRNIVLTLRNIRAALPPDEDMGGLAPPPVVDGTLERAYRFCNPSRTNRVS